jgi:hypothetical protein
MFVVLPFVVTLIVLVVPFAFAFSLAVALRLCGAGEKSSQ